MKIVFVSPLGLKINANYCLEYQVGAIEQQIFGLAKELSIKGCETFIIRRWNSSDEIETIRKVNFVNINLPATQKEFRGSFSLIRMPIEFTENLLFSVKAYKKINELTPDIIHASTLLQAYFIFRLNVSNSRKVFITHSHDVFLGKGVISYVKKMVLDSIIRKSTAVVTLNKGIQNYLRNQGFRADFVIPNALSLEDHKNKGEDNFILYAGRLVKHKRLTDLIKVFSEISEDTEKDLVIIGSGPCEGALKSYAASLGVKDRVIFISFLPRSKYRDYLSKCSVFVLPSEAEAFGVVIIEAMASGKPVIARSIIGPRDIIAHGHDGFLFENNDELKKYLKLLLSDKGLRKKLGKNARRTVEEKYTFDKVARQYLKLYESLIETRAPKATKDGISP